MTDKITLSNVADLTQSITAAATINANSATIQTAFDNTLSRDGTQPNTKLEPNIRLNTNELYLDFVNEYPDYSPRAKMSISRIRFNKWLHSFCLYKEGVPPEEGKDLNGKWLMIKQKDSIEEEDIIF